MHTASRKERAWLILTSGFAVFSMFFGSGNLVFPLMLGQTAEAAYPSAALGLLLSGVIMPGLGLWGILLYQGSVERFFHTLGKQAAFWIPLLMLCLLGPFGVIPRCITVSFGSIEALIPGQSYILFSFLFCLGTYLLLLCGHRMIDIMGGLLTPVLLVALATIIGTALHRAAPLVPHYDLSQAHHGIAQGYQMMDLLAAFFFAAAITHHLGTRAPTRQYAFTLAAIGIGGAILATVYLFLVYLGATYAPALFNISPEQSIAHIAYLTLGTQGSFIVAVTVIMACLTTAVALAKVFIRFMQDQVLANKVPPQVTTVAVLGLTFVVSLLKFEGIARIVGPVLEVLYPGLVLLTLLNIIHHFRPLRYIAPFVYATFILSGLVYLTNIF